MSGEEMQTPPPEWTTAAGKVIQGIGYSTVRIMLSQSWDFCEAGNGDGEVVPAGPRHCYHVIVFVTGGTISGISEKLDEAVSEARKNLRSHFTDDKR